MSIVDCNGKPMKVGDIVLVLKPDICCGNSMHLGSIWDIFEIKMWDGGSTCGICGHRSDEVIVWRKYKSMEFGFFPQTLKVLPQLKESNELEISEQNPYLKGIKEKVEA